MNKYISYPILGIAVLSIISCGTMNYYQIYKTSPIGGVTKKDNYLTYEDASCKITYNLWAEGGNIGFTFYNKSDKNLYLNLDESFFILNGIAYDYFNNRVITNSRNYSMYSSRSVSGTQIIEPNSLIYNTRPQSISNGFTSSSSASSGYSISLEEKKLICVPPKTSKVIVEYSITKLLYRDCDLLKYPNKKQVVAKNFTKENSPFVFSNLLLYTVGKEGQPVKVNNEFFVSEISNLPESEVLTKKTDDMCGQKSMKMLTYFKISDADKFYVKYSKGGDTSKY